MKFPTSRSLFPAISLPTSEAHRHEQLAQALVQDTLAEYDQFNHAHHRQVCKTRWKTVKTREGITVYKERDHDAHDNVHRGLASGLANLSRAHSASVLDSISSGSSASRASTTALLLETIPAEEWNLPKLLMVGTLSGTLDDVMYGLATPDASLILLKASYTQDEVIDGQILAQIHGPTPREPYRFLGIKWLVKGNPMAVSALVCERDIVMLEATGTQRRPNGDRIGYFLMHSVNVPGVHSLESHSVVRGKISTCYIFKQLPNGLVDVYMKGYVEAGGKIVDSVALLSAANGLLCCWKSVVCSQSKKLVWMLQHKRRSSKRAMASASDIAQSPCCGFCSRQFKMFNSAVSCKLCDLVMCSRCRVAMKLTFATIGVKHLHQRNVVVCKSCITSTSQHSTFEIAQQEVLSGRFGPVRASSTDLESSNTQKHAPESEGGREGTVLLLPDAAKLGSHRSQETRYPATETSAATNSDGDSHFESEDDESVSEHEASDFVEWGGAASEEAHRQFVENTQGQTPEEQKMWARMAQLHFQAETLYQFTKNTTDQYFSANGAATASAPPNAAEPPSYRESID